MLDHKEGQAIPEVTFHTRVDDEWVDVTTSQLFKEKNVIVFSLPGAFTPTCSSSHLPRYNELAPTFKQLGIDAIYCVSVNDTFVMNAWADNQQADNIQFLPDGNGEFSAAMGMLVDKQDIGFGKRSWRYAMLVKNGLIDKMFIEPQTPGDPFEVSDADTMLNYLDPEMTAPSSVSLITKPGCPHCKRAKELLNTHGMSYEEIVLGHDASTVSLNAITGLKTVPQVFIDGKHIGGARELSQFLEA